MKRWAAYLSVLACLSMSLCGCGTEIDEQVLSDAMQIIEETALEELENAVLEDLGSTELDGALDEETLDDSENTEAEDISLDDYDEEVDDMEGTSYDDYIPDEIGDEPVIVEGGSYTTKEEVALYIYTYGELPANFITKSEAQDLGWVSKKGNLHEVAPGMSIGGDRYGNYEQILPDGKYKECDINYYGGYRGDERIVYSEDGYIYYTDDHYESFTQLYPEAS